MSEEFQQTDGVEVSQTGRRFARRRFMKTAGAAGATAVGIGVFGGQAAASDHAFQDAEATIEDSLLTVVVQNINVEEVEILRITVQDVTVEEVVTVEDVTVTIEDIDVLANVQVVVQALSPEGEVLQTATLQAN